MSDLIKNTTDASFDGDVKNSSTAVLLDFWAPWCGPCKQIAPVLEQVAGDYEGKLQIVKLNVDENTEVAKQYGVRGIPTLMVFKDGEVAGTKVGALTADQLKTFINEHV